MTYLWVALYLYILCKGIFVFLNLFSVNFQKSKDTEFEYQYSIERRGLKIKNYRDFIIELKSMTLFQNIEDNALIALLDVMEPEIVIKKAGQTSMPPIDIENGLFCVVLKGKPLDQLESRWDIYNMPKFGEPGMMMGEIPCLSEMLKSLAPRPRLIGMPHGGMPEQNYDLYLLRMSGEMITRFYGEQYMAAQSTMLRNFLGILAQKVTDIRKEKSELSEQAANELAPYRLNVFCAGVSVNLVLEVEEKWNALHPELPVVITPGGSVDLVRECINGRPCDLLISADDEIIRTMMMPEYADGYRIWAGNKIVVAGKDISSENWEEKLLAADATFKHHSPYADPSGYRAVMALLLADLYKPGLTDQLMNHPGHIGMEKNPGPFGNLKKAKYEFTYYSSVISSETNFAQLPEVMDLSNPKLADIYEKASFSVDSINTITATPIAHALTIPKTAGHEKEASDFARMFLEIDKDAAGFLPREGVVGENPVK